MQQTDTDTMQKYFGNPDVSLSLFGWAITSEAPLRQINPEPEERDRPSDRVEINFRVRGFHEDAEPVQIVILRNRDRLLARRQAAEWEARIRVNAPHYRRMDGSSLEAAQCLASAVSAAASLMDVMATDSYKRDLETTYWEALLRYDAAVEEERQAREARLAQDPAVGDTAARALVAAAVEAVREADDRDARVHFKIRARGVEPDNLPGKYSVRFCPYANRLQFKDRHGSTLSRAFVTNALAEAARDGSLAYQTTTGNYRAKWEEGVFWQATPTENDDVKVTAPSKQETDA